MDISGSSHGTRHNNRTMIRIFEKLVLYEKFRVREYWIVQPGAKMIFKYILDENGEYKKPEIVKKNEVLSSSSVPAVEIDLTRVFPD